MWHLWKKPFKSSASVLYTVCKTLESNMSHAIVRSDAGRCRPQAPEASAEKHPYNRRFLGGVRCLYTPFSRRASASKTPGISQDRHDAIDGNSEVTGEQPAAGGASRKNP